MVTKIGDLTLYTAEELSKALSIHKATIYRMLRDGRLKGRKMAKVWYVTEEALQEYFRPPSFTVETLRLRTLEKLEREGKLDEIGAKELERARRRVQALETIEERKLEELEKVARGSQEDG